MMTPWSGNLIPPKTSQSNPGEKRKKKNGKCNQNPHYKTQTKRVMYIFFCFFLYFFIAPCPASLLFVFFSSHRMTLFASMRHAMAWPNEFLIHKQTQSTPPHLGCCCSWWRCNDGPAPSLWKPIFQSLSLSFERAQTSAHETFKIKRLVPGEGKI
jgi:hypothetical protein